MWARWKGKVAALGAVLLLAGAAAGGEKPGEGADAGEGERVRRLGEGAPPEKEERSPKRGSREESLETGEDSPRGEPEDLEVLRGLRRANVVRLYKTARQLFRAQDYLGCAAICEYLLKVDPRHLEAAQLKSAAELAHLNLTQKLEDEKDRKRDLEAILETHKEARWPQEKARLRRPLRTRQKEPVSAARAALETKLESRISINFVNADLDYVLSTLFKLSGINIITDPSVIEGKQLSVHLENIPLKELLEYITSQFDDLAFSVTDNAVWLHSPEKPRMVVKYYPLNSALLSVEDFAGAVRPAGGGAGGRGRAGGARTTDRNDTRAPPPPLPDDLSRLLGTRDQNDLGALLPDLPPDAKAGQNPGALFEPETPLFARPPGGGGGRQPQQQQGKSYIEAVLEWMEQWSQLWPADTEYLLDRQNHQLLMLTTPEFHQTIEQMLDEVDQAPVQVLVKARFIEIFDDRDFGLGLDIQNLATRTDYGRDPKLSVGAHTGTGLAMLTAPLVTFTGRRTDPQFTAFLHAIDRTRDAKVLSAPAVLAINNRTALIDITQRIPYITDFREVTTTTTTETGTVTNVSALVPEFDEAAVGFTFEVRPSVGRDMRTIILDLHPLVDELTQGVAGNTISAFGGGEVVTGAPGQPAVLRKPIIDQRELRTTMVIEDDGYVVIGGLIRYRRETVERKLPLLSEVPILGWLFRSQGTENRRSNLIIVVEAKIIAPSGRKYTDAPEAPQSNAEAQERERSDKGGDMLHRYGPEAEVESRFEFGGVKKEE